MKIRLHVLSAAVLCVLSAASVGVGADRSAVALPDGVRAVWDMSKAYHEKTPTRERVCLNGLWRWQPAAAVETSVPAGNWGFFKVPALARHQRVRSEGIAEGLPEPELE